MAKARSLSRTVLIPVASAAVSSSRIATQARPMRLWSMRVKISTAMSKRKISRK
jgi:hypothetical protein